MAEALRRGRRFVMHDVWHIGRPGEEIPHGFIPKHIRMIVLLAKHLWEDDLLLRASALTFATILSIVPFLAIMFFIIQTFNVGEAIGDLLEPSLPSGVAAVPSESAERNRELWETLIALLFGGFEQPGNIAPDGRQLTNPVKMIMLYAERSSNPRTLTLAGIVFVLSAVFGLMMNVEASFNKIWNLPWSRSWYRILSDYLMILLLLPFMVSAVLSATAVLESAVITRRLGSFAVGLRGIQFVLSYVVLTLMYYFIPKTRVKFRYALFAGIVAGTIWCLMSWAYVRFQFGLPRYNIVYLTFAQIPILLMWVYFSWLTLLFGAVLAFAYQHEPTFAMERFMDTSSFAYKESLGIWAAIEVCRRFDAGLPGMSIEDCSRQWNVPSRMLNTTFDVLEKANIFVKSASNPPTYQPARSIDKITMADVMNCLRNAGDNPSALRQDPVLRDAMQTALRIGPERCSMADLVRRAGSDESAART
ncbi:MAG TPA: YihY/virulence factor BrkB family protein [Candidatus Hydrogenedentes bacterium]|nr:YihY/virulence factor BrkB family protein [Candidatus Hydrogenedentota bacterium]